jgi:hypothetical protein
MYGRQQPPDPSFVRPGKAACLAVATAAIAFHVHGASLGHAQKLVDQARNTVADAIAGPQFNDAAFALERYHTLAGTYDGADVEGRRIVVRWATDRTYCIEGVSQSGAVEYVLGPHGHIAPGTCPVNSF